MKLLLFNILVLLALGTTSCNKFLSENPDLRAELNTSTKIRELLTSAYPQASYVAFTEAASDNADDKGPERPYDAVNADPWKFKDVISTDWDTPIYYWTQSYSAIAAANVAIEAYFKLPDGLKDPSILGEAYLARAYAHFMLVTLYANTYDPLTAKTDPGIPYVKEAGKTVIKKYDRSTVEDIYAQIQRDIEDGIPLINDAKYVKAKYHFTKAAANAFAARFFLFKKDYLKVIEYADKVFGKDIKPFLRQINSATYKGMEYNKRQQWFASPDNPANLLLIEVKSLLGRNYSGYRYGITTALNAELMFSGNVTESGEYGYSIYGNVTHYNHPKWDEYFIRSGLQANWGWAYVTHVALTADELLLNRAEAYAHLGKYQEAVDDLNQFASAKIVASSNDDKYDPTYHKIDFGKIRDFYKTNDLEEGLTKAVLDFKRREFLQEGLRYFDILRYKLPVTHVSIDQKEKYYLSPTDSRRVFQMPEEVTLSGIQMNPR